MTAGDNKRGKDSTQESLERRARTWDAEHQQHQEQSRLEARFAGCSGAELLAMWRAGKNERGKRLTKIEVEALVEAFVRVFGEYPPTTTDGASASDSSVQITDEAALVRRTSAAELLGVSLATIDRMEKDGRLPSKTRLGKAIAGWRLSELHAAMDQGNSKPRR